jgi:hypothetical protein
MSVPFYILIAKERAHAFRRYVALLRSQFADNPPDHAWDELWRILDEFTWPGHHRWRHYGHLDGHPLMSALDRALLWAHGSPTPPADWISECLTLAAAEKRRVETSLAEGWPVGTAEEEQKALREMKAGASVGLEETFARIAGVSEEEWLRRVKEHKFRRRPAGEGE